MYVGNLLVFYSVTISGCINVNYKVKFKASFNGVKVTCSAGESMESHNAPSDIFCLSPGPRCHSTMAMPQEKHPQTDTDDGVS